MYIKKIVSAVFIGVVALMLMVKPASAITLNTSATTNRTIEKRAKMAHATAF